MPFNCTYKYTYFFGKSELVLHGFVFKRNSVLMVKMAAKLIKFLDNFEITFYVMCVLIFGREKLDSARYNLLSL